MASDALWRNFPKTLPEFERRFGSEEACRRYLVKVRWDGRVRCARCDGQRLWALSRRRLFECRDCGFQTSLTAGTPFERTQKPLRLWFRAVWEMVSRKNGVSAKDLQRILGFGSYETAWTWLHKLRAAMDPSDHSKLRGAVQLNEGFVGGYPQGILARVGAPVGRSTAHKQMVIVGAEYAGRVRMWHGIDSSEATLGRFIAANVEQAAEVTTDGWRGYSKKALAGRAHRRVPKRAPRGNDAVQHCHWAIGQLKRWWLGTHHGAVRAKYTQRYLDEFTFRYNRRKTNGVGRLVARLLQQLVAISARPAKIIRQSMASPHYLPEAIG